MKPKRTQAGEIHYLDKKSDRLRPKEDIVILTITRLFDTLQSTGLFKNLSWREN